MDAPTGKQARQEFWFAHVKAWRASGLTQRDYCRQHHLKSADVLSYWVNREKGMNAPAITLVPAKLTPSPGQGNEIRLMSPTGWQLSLPSSLSVEYVADLVRRLT